MEILVTKDTKDKIRVVEIDYEWDNQQHGYVIHRTTYQYGGKQTVQPEELLLTNVNLNTILILKSI